MKLRFCAVCCCAFASIPFAHAQKAADSRPLPPGSYGPRETINMPATPTELLTGAGAQSNANSANAPPDPNAGLPSSSRPITGNNQRDSFDLAPSSNGTSGVAYGSKGAIGQLGDEAPPEIPDIHLVKKGDTLWNLSQTYFQNPWAWPKVWRMNPQVINPHWIYPGDQMRLSPSNSAGKSLARSSTLSADGTGGFVHNRPVIPERTVFLRDRGYLADPERDEWGKVVGAREDRALLAYGNHIYVDMRDGVNLRIGQLLTIYDAVRMPDLPSGSRKLKGEIVSVHGTVRVEQWNPQTRIARGVVIEALDVIERGARVGAVGRRFDIVPPRRSEKVVNATVIGSFYPHVYLGQHNLAFIDRGSDDGLRPGNELKVVRKHDAWRKSLQNASRVARTRVRVESPDHLDVEQVPLSGDDQDFPEEITAELRVIRVEKTSAVVLITHSAFEVQPGDLAYSKPAE